MKYTKGIRKMFSTNNAGDTLTNVAMSALDAGFRLIIFNGEVYHVWRKDADGNITINAIGLAIGDFAC